VAFRGNQDRGLLLTSTLVAGWVSWHLGYQALVLVACAAPATVFRALSFLLSWFDKPVTATPAGRARLDRLHVTVAVPVYNEDPGLLDRCIFAVMNQSRPAELVWVVDDGSATDYAALERHWAGKWANGTEVRWSRQPNLGKRQAHARAQPPAMIMLSCLLVAAALIAPAEQARIHELPSLDKNMAFGVPFAALGAGYALSAGRAWLARGWPWGTIAATMTVCVAILAVAVSGRFEKIQFRGPGIAAADQIVTAISRSYRPGTLVLSDGASRMEQYYLPGIPPTAWVRTYTHSAGQRLLLADQIRSCLISVAVFRSGGASNPYDPTVMRWLRHAGRYRLATVATSGAYRTAVWTLQPGPRRRGRCR
jgi:hypothetical protein